MGAFLIIAIICFIAGAYTFGIGFFLLGVILTVITKF